MLWVVPSYCLGLDPQPPTPGRPGSRLGARGLFERRPQGTSGKESGKRKGQCPVPSWPCDRGGSSRRPWITPWSFSAAQPGRQDVALVLNWFSTLVLNSPWLRTAPKDSGSWQFWPACLRSGHACAPSRKHSRERLQAPEEATAVSRMMPAKAGHQQRCYSRVLS